MSTDYGLYPIVDEITDKVCATMSTATDRPSSQEKDLVDLLVIATSHALEATFLTTVFDSVRGR